MKSLVLLKLAHVVIALALVFGAWGAMPAAAQAAAEPAESLAPQARLADLLRPDGTLDLTTGFRGSVDARGYRLVGGVGEWGERRPGAYNAGRPRERKLGRRVSGEGYEL